MEPPLKKRKLLQAIMINEIDSSESSMVKFVTILQNISNDMALWYYLGLLEDETHLRIPTFYETWINNYIECDFFGHFRMGRQTFYNLLNCVGRHYIEPLRRGRGVVLPLPVEKALLLAVWYLAKGDLLQSIANTFNVCVKTVHTAIKKCLQCMCFLSSSVIRWPTEEQCVNIEEQFRHIGGYPGVIGAIDGCHFEAKINNMQHDSYQNRKFRHTVIMQGVCLSNYLLTNISVGYPGSIHDARVLRESNLHRLVVQLGSQYLFYNKYHLIGDSAYPCKIWLMKPYQSNNISRSKKYHNTVLSKTRVVIENTFGQLKGRWRILNFINVYSVRKVSQIITSCCFLHNFCIRAHDLFDAGEYAEHQENQDFEYEDDNEAVEKRDSICVSLLI